VLDISLPAMYSITIMRINGKDREMTELTLVADGWMEKGVRVVCWRYGSYDYEIEIYNMKLTSKETKVTIPYKASYEATIAHVKEMCAATNACCVY